MSLIQIRGVVLMTYYWVAAVAGGLALTGGASMLTAVGLHRAGIDLADAMNLASILGFLFFVGLVMWTFARQTLLRATIIVLLAMVSIPAAISLAPEVSLY